MGVVLFAVYLPAESMQTHYSAVVGTERSNRVRKNFLQRQKDLMVQPTHKITMCPTSQHGEKHRSNHTCEMGKLIKLNIILL